MLSQNVFSIVIIVYFKVIIKFTETFEKIVQDYLFYLLLIVVFVDLELITISKNLLHPHYFYKYLTFFIIFY